MKKIGWILVAGIISGCLVSRNQSAKTMNSFDTQGHRGCRGLMPENTIPAMLYALDLGVHTLEMDAVISKDGQVLLSHEPFFNHEISTTPNGKRVTQEEEKSLNMYQMNYAEIVQFDVGMAPHPRFPQQKRMRVSKPLLADVIDSVKAYCTSKNLALPYFNIETKSDPTGDAIYHPLPAEFVDRLVQVIQNKQISNQVIIQSFDPRTLQYLHEKYPDIRTALLIEDNDSRSFAVQLQQLGFIPSIYSPASNWVTPLLVKQCKEMGMLLVPWTVNDLSTLQQLKNMGVNGIISDYPNLFAQLK
ncbi:MAG: glycerophosphodiester phosphodiesterase family protein [Bacteroidetes bacterium]|nr:glycerophosphodiester phosphodiesterase family protein [Bacteroidota bacterium]